MNKPLRPCNYPSCNVLTRDGYCDKHKPKEKPRLSSKKRGYTSKWSRASKMFLSTHPWCAECERQRRRTLATETDHIIPHKGNMKLFWDKNNWQPLCHRCHSIKTAKEDGGFGHKVRR